MDRKLLKKLPNLILENLYIIIFFVIIFGMPILSTIEKDKTFSDYENRVLQEFPTISSESILNSTFQTQFDTYVSDQMIWKNQIVRLKNYFDLMQMKIAINEVYLADDDYYIERHSIKDYDLDLLQENVKTLNTFKKKYNADIYLVPNANVVLNSKLGTNDDVDFNVLMKDIENIDYVDNILKNYVNSNNLLYYKTDHHWTTYGAHLLYQNIVEDPVPLNLGLVDNYFYGTINNKLNIKMKPDSIYKQISDTDFDVYYDMGTKDLGLYFDKHLYTKDKYAYFLDANHGLIQITNNDIKSDEKLLIIKDSYANCIIPFLAENYKQVDVIDLRFFNLGINTYLKDNKYDRIIVLYNKDGFAKDKNIYKLGI